MRLILILVFFWIAVVSNAQENPFITHYNYLRSFPVIGFGEASHGSYSDYIARRDLISCLTYKGEKVDVLIEMPAATGFAIEEYYRGEIEIDSLLKVAAYYGLQTDAFIQLVDGFHGYNNVTFHGVDMQTLQPELSYLVKFSTELFPERQNAIARAYDSLNYNFLREFEDSAYWEYRPVISRNCATLFQILSPNIISAGKKFRDARFLLKTIEQHFQMLDYVKNNEYEKYNLYRDSCMAQNILEFQQRTLNQCVVLAANGHIMSEIDKKYTMMGGHLKEALGDDYYVIASQYVSGSLLEVDVIDEKRVIEERKLKEVLKNSLPDRLNKLIQPETEILITRNFDNAKVRLLLNRKTLGQDMGTGTSWLDYESAGYYYFRKKDYDAIFLIPEVKASKNYFD